MTKPKQLLQRAIRNPASLRFEEMIRLVEAFGFRRARQRGSHHIFVHRDISELVNIQDVDGVAKPY